MKEKQNTEENTRRKSDLQERFIEDELIAILFKSVETSKKKEGAIATSSLGYWMFRVGYWILIKKEREHYRFIKMVLTH